MTKLLFVVIILASCSSPTSTQPENSSPSIISPDKFRSKADQIVTQMSCGGSEWQDGEVLEYSCERVDERWKCLCNGTSFFSSEEVCRDALIDSCNVSDQVFGGCQSTLGECNPDGDDLRCQCGDDASTFTTTQEECAEDLFAMCADSCEVGSNSCVPSAGLIDHYRCTCGAEAPKSSGGNSCEAALDKACNQVKCSSWTGYCQEVTSPEFGYECQCVDGTTEMLTVNELETDECGEALETICGTPDDDECRTEDERGWRSCRPVPGRTDMFDCSCWTQCEADERMIVDTFTGNTCDETLLTFCDFDELCAR